MAQTDTETRTLVIDVTEADIEDASHGSASQCPVALAAMRATGERSFVVGYIHIGNTIYEPTPEIMSFITRFDAGDEVAPATFRVRQRT